MAERTHTHTELLCKESYCSEASKGSNPRGGGSLDRVNHQTHDGEGVFKADLGGPKSQLKYFCVSSSRIKKQAATIRLLFFF